MEETTQPAAGSPITPIRKNKGLAVLAYLLFFVPLLTDAKDDPFVRYHVKQGLALFIAWIVALIIKMLPLIGWVLWPFLRIILLLLMLVGVVHAIEGKEAYLPVIGKRAEKLQI